MPELAEVEFMRKRWNPGLGQRIAAVRLHPKAGVFRSTKPAQIARHAGRYGPKMGVKNVDLDVRERPANWRELTIQQIGRGALKVGAVNGRLG